MNPSRHASAHIVKFGLFINKYSYFFSFRFSHRLSHQTESAVVCGGRFKSLSFTNKEQAIAPFEFDKDTVRAKLIT